jgi:hypothetical protein
MGNRRFFAVSLNVSQLPTVPTDDMLLAGVMLLGL